MNKSLTILFLLFAGIGFSQSKKELRATLATSQHTIDSLQHQLEIKSKTIDTLALSFVKAQKNYLNQLEVSKDLTAEYRNCQQENTALEQENTQLKSNKAPKTTSQNHANRPSTKNPDNNPFGNASQTENTEENSIETRRYIIKTPDVSSIDSDETCSIVFNLTIDEYGYIKGTPEVIKQGTTTANTSLIQEATALIKSQVRYNASPGSKDVKKSFILRLAPQ